MGNKIDKFKHICKMNEGQMSLNSGSILIHSSIYKLVDNGRLLYFPEDRVGQWLGLKT